MRILILFFILVQSSLSWSAPNLEAWDKVLAQAGLTREQLHFDPYDQLQFGGAQLQIPFLKPVHSDPLRIPFYARIFRELSLEQAAKPVDLTLSALARLGIGVRRTLVSDPLKPYEERSKKPEALLNAIANVHSLGGQPLSVARAGELKNKIAKLPAEIKPMIAYLLEAEMLAYKWRQKALAQIGGSTLQKAFAERTEQPKTSGENDMDGASPLFRKLSSDVDIKWMVSGGLDLIQGVGKVIEQLKELKESGNFAFEWSTPLGEIAVNGSEKNTYAGNKAYLLIMDFGGEDTYYGGGGSFDLSHPVSVLIDVKGNDQYLADAKLQKTEVIERAERKSAKSNPAFGAGVFGYGILVDVAGDDSYRSYRQTQGRGDFGIGMLWDIAGRDQYDCYVQCQGSGGFGAGILNDQAGEDNYKSVQQSQGYGDILGVGLLVDSGLDNDNYVANDSVIDFPATVDPKHNTSMAQGAANGLRADFIDGHSYAGGLGALIDGGGNNSLSAGFFSQGSAYWYSVAILSMGVGNDKYQAAKYSQGAGTHYAVGILNDLGGNDSYKVEQELGIGAGHDFSVGFLYDEGGDDTYKAPALSLGCGSANGIGIFWDKAGNDDFSAPEKLSLGCASYRIPENPTIRERAPTIGVFLDTGGKNKFTTKIKGPDKGSWINEGDGPAKVKAKLIGIGLIIDRPNTSEP